MAKNKLDIEKQPELLSEERASDQATTEEQIDKVAFRQRLRAYLHDPEFRKTEGFPIGEDEDILALSDPPYYTACPNPFLGEIIEKWQKERSELREKLGLPDDSQENGNGLKIYHREPFASDVSEGKNDPIYNAHSYHTKVPHKAVMRYILHYTDPGDIVLDGFCGTGMTGVAAQLCGDKKAVESLGYIVQRNDKVFSENGEAYSMLGSRKAVLVDLSPAATLIAQNYNAPVNAIVFEKEARRILKEVENECSWMYETWHPNSDSANRIRGKINYTIWSDVFACPHCGEEMIYWDVALDLHKGVVRDEWSCPKCNTLLAKKANNLSNAMKVDRAWETKFDRAIGRTVQQAKQVPVLINYTVGKKRYEKRADSDDLVKLQTIEETNIPYPFPTDRMPEGDEARRNDDIGVTHVHHFHTRRNLYALSTLWPKSKGQLTFIFTSLLQRSSKLVMTVMSNYFKKVMGEPLGGYAGKPMVGTLYIPSINTEVSVIEQVKTRTSSLAKMQRNRRAFPNSVIITNMSSTKLDIGSNTVDYIFTDPPFGSNIWYSELSFLWEAWLGIKTNNAEEAVENKTQKKGLSDYTYLMEQCFTTFHQVLKPGKWMTVEFHNSQNKVWNAIQEAILRSGFVIADVRTLDKQQGSFKQVTSSGSVKQDLVISAYKPYSNFERLFRVEGGSVQGVWAFIRQHLEQLPIPSVINNMVESLAERQNYLLYDRMVAFHIMRGLAVPLSAAEFYQGLGQRFIPRDNMFFNPEQAAEYDKRRLGVEQVEQLALFVSDEKSALQWLRRELDSGSGYGPQTYQDLQPKFLKELHSVARYEDLPELRDILEDNFLKDENGCWHIPNPEKQADLEALRQKSLLREFNDYLKGKGRLRIFRSEAVRAGFSHYWKERDYDTILRVADRLPSNVLEEEQQLLMYVHNAALRHSQQPKQERLL